jgi:DNA modification methylase
MPVVIDQSSRVICGHARVEACKLLGIDRVPSLRVTDLSEDQLRGLMLADNRLSELSTWDDQLLAENFKILSDLEFDVECMGFDYGEIEQRIRAIDEATGSDDDDEDVPDPRNVPRVSRVGDLWQLGPADRMHRLLCGNSTETLFYQHLLGDHRAAMVFTDPPYNIPAHTIGKVCSDSHGNFEMGSGEMTSDQFRGFLSAVMKNVCSFSEPGSIHYFFMDWRHAPEILAAGEEQYSEFKNLCVWVKDHPGMGAFYRSQHELVFVFKHGEAPHRNHFGLGQHGRTRSNVWCFSSVRSLDSTAGDPGGDEALRLHPTVKPVSLIQNAILDCSRRGDTVLDPFLGSGSTLIACEKTDRLLVGIEISPRYVDVAITRWEQWTGGEAVHKQTGHTFADLAERRAEEDPDA